MWHADYVILMMWHADCVLKIWKNKKMNNNEKKSEKYISKNLN